MTPMDAFDINVSENQARAILGVSEHTRPKYDPQVPETLNPKPWIF